MTAPASRRVALIVRDQPLRRLLEPLLRDDGWTILSPPSLPALLDASGQPQAGLDVDLALVDWGLTGGLLSESRRSDLQVLNSLLPLVLIVPGSWTRHLRAEDVGVAALVGRPFDLPYLLPLLEGACRQHA